MTKEQAQIFVGDNNKELYISQSVLNLVLMNSIYVNINIILAFTNSKLTNFCPANKYLGQSKDLLKKTLIQNCKQLPIPIIYATDKQQKAQNKKIAKQVENIEAIQQSLLTTKNKNQTDTKPITSRRELFRLCGLRVVQLNTN